MLRRLLNFGRAEHRQSSGYTNLAIDALVQNALGATPKVVALAAVESCVSIIADPFNVATVEGFPVPRAMLHDAARDLLRHGESCYLLDVDDDGLHMVRAARWEIAGRSPDPSRWSYSLEIEAPGGTIERRSPGEGVLHFRMNASRDTPWRGLPPWKLADLSSAALAAIERGVRDESKIPSGRVWTGPDGMGQNIAQGMADALKDLAGRMVITPTTAMGMGQGKIAAPAKDWMPTATGQDHKPGNVNMRTAIEGSISAAYGVPALFLNPAATAPGVREAKRLAYLNKTKPLASLMATELTTKLNTNVNIRWPNEADQSVDVTQRTRGLQALKDFEGIDLDLILQWLGLSRDDLDE